MTKMTLWGFDGSTYVRSVKMLLAEKGVTDFEQVPLNVLEGDPKKAEHLERHPFGKVPVLDHNGLRILETSAITRYLNDVLPGKSLIPAKAESGVRKTFTKPSLGVASRQMRWRASSIGRSATACAIAANR